jgi:hypothetical protein
MALRAEVKEVRAGYKYTNRRLAAVAFLHVAFAPKWG